MITHSIDKKPAQPVSLPIEPAPELSSHYQLLLNRLRSSELGGDRLQAIGLISCTRGEGVSTVAAQLGFTAAAQLSVVLVEANWRRPSLAARLGVPQAPGLADLLLNRCELEEAVHAAASSKLFVLPWGRMTTDLAAARGAGGFAEVLTPLRERFDLVLVDLPPAGRSESTMPWTSLLDGVLLVVEAERVDEEVARQAQALLSAAQAHVLGAVLNKRREYLPHWMDRRS